MRHPAPFLLEWVIPSSGVVAGAIIAYLVSRLVVRGAGGKLQRVNVDGQRVPAVLGWTIVAGALVGALVTFAYVLYENQVDRCPDEVKACELILIHFPSNLAWLPLIPIIGMFIVGLWDDLRGDERPRGFGGHLAALRGGAITGGMVKLAGGVIVALVTIFAIDGEIPPIIDWVLLAAPIALSANLVNLLDRAPGRALKFFLVCSLPMWFFVYDWRVFAAGTLGAAIGTLPFDIRARGMLGDAGANPLGAILGLGIILSTLQLSDDRGSMRLLLGATILVLLGLNLASERWSFSAVIERTPWLARLDHLGRK